MLWAAGSAFSRQAPHAYLPSQVPVSPWHPVPVCAAMETQFLDMIQGRAPKSFFSHLRGAFGAQSTNRISIPGVLMGFIGIRAPIVWIQTWWPGCPLWFLITACPSC